MTRAWRLDSLTPGGSRQLGGTFTPVAQVTGLTQTFAIPASGFLVHPRIVVTAAHAVTFFSGEQVTSVERVRVRVGNLQAWAERIATDQAYFASHGNNANSDLAVLLLSWPVCAPTETLSLGPDFSATSEASATVWGWRDGIHDRWNVQPEWNGPMLTYSSPNLPGFSGGPVVVPPGSAHMGRAIGVHVGFQARTGHGEAVPVTFDDARDAMVSLGFSF